jgi:RNA polymerase sigma factor (sigma-70 family)
MDQQDGRTDRWFEALPTSRARLVRLCARLTGNRDVAEDLAQETLLAAWRQRHTLRDQERFSHWLSGIARNVCLSWARARRRDLAHAVEQCAGAENQEGDLEEELADGFDLAIELERKELAELLDRALALLPPETRAVLIERYIEESPLAEIAAHLGLPLSTTAKRVQRGKLAFRRVLTTDLKEELAPYLIQPEALGWEATGLWCFICGQHRLQARQLSTLQFTCPQCCPDRHAVFFNCNVVNPGVKGYRRAFEGLLTWIENRYRPYLAARTLPCAGCGQMTPIHLHPDASGFRASCPRCHTPAQEENSTFSLAQTQVRRFWHEQGRIRRLPRQEVEADGRPALAIPFESITSQAGITVVLARDTHEVLRIVEDHA